MKVLTKLLSVFFRIRSCSSSVLYRYRKILCATFVSWLALAMVYICQYTPLPVYVLDRLNLRPLFLPNLTCHACNNFTYRYIVDNRNFCSTAAQFYESNHSKLRYEPDDIFLLILVATFHANADARRAIRKSWGSIREYRGKSIRTLFILGRHEDPNYNYQVQYELQRYGDVVQVDFTDHYRWLTNKTMVALQWVSDFCPGAQYVLKTDDDGFNVPQRFVDYLIGVTAEKFIGGYCFTVMPDRREGSKFYVPLSMYPDRYYPTYCSGPGYILSRAAVAGVLRIANNVIFLPMEDVFVSGICRVAAGVLYTQIVGVAEDQREMTPCNLATWVKNGHNIYPHATPELWQRAVNADRHTDCTRRNARTLMMLAIFIFIWCRHLSYIIQSGLEPNVVVGHPATRDVWTSVL